MAWPPTREDFEQTRAELEERVAERPRGHPLEQLGRTLMWLGEEDEARRRFREAAEAVQTVIERYPEREDAFRMAHVASLLWLAGDGDAARPWIDRAQRAAIDPGTGAALHYLAGDFDRAATTARLAAEDPEDGPSPRAEALEALSIARRDGDAEPAGRAHAAFAGMVREDRFPPHQESGAAGLSLSDWYVESARMEAELRGEPPPGYDELLARLKR